MSTNKIMHNLMAMNANRMLGINTKSKAKSTEKLSSGYCVNRAADDAAALAISEKLRWQVRGLNRSALNIQDGISICQVADGALNETTAVLQRMRELAIQSANGTNSVSDRLCIEMEFEQLWYEVDRIATETEFNTEIYPLNAALTYKPGSTDPDTPDVPDVSGPSEPDFPPEFGPDEGLIKEMTITFTTDRACTYDGKQYQAGDTITVEGLTTNGTEIWINGGSIYYPGAWGNSNNIIFSDLGPLKKADLEVDGDGYLYYVNRLGEARYAVYFTDPSRLSPFNGSGGNPDPIHFTDKTSAEQQIRGGDCRYMTVDDLTDKEPDPPKPSEPDSPKPPAPDSPTAPDPVYSGKPINIQSGALAWQAIQIRTVNATCEGLGITSVTVATEDSAGKAMGLLADAIDRVSAYRSAFGAMQNRLEHAKKINENTSENSQSAESKMRDTDMAAEMVQYSKTNILEQAGQSILAQANQITQGVLNLIE